jgi:uncharacterized membrane protein
MMKLSSICAHFLQCLLSILVLSLAITAGLTTPAQSQTKVVTRQITEILKNPSTGDADNIHEDFVVGKVRSVSAPELNQALQKGTGMVTRTQLVDIEIQEGALRGKKVQVLNELTDNPSFNISVQPGREVILSLVSEPGKNQEINIADYHRAPVLAVLLLVFLAAFIFFGGKSALKSLVGLATAIGLVGFVLLPLSLSGFNPLLSSACICFVSACVTILCVGGFSRKSLAAAIGTIGGVIIAGLAAQLVIDQAPLTGLSSEEAQLLRASMSGQPLRFFSGLLAASMLIGALGVIMDVGISIASSIFELSRTDQRLTARQLYDKGMNVGRDIMGSMTCTLVLAYTGSALPLLILISTMPSLKLVNLDLVASEIAAALTGSLGLVFTIPLTALAAARLMAAKQRPGNGSPASDPFANLDNASAFINNNVLSTLPEASSLPDELAPKVVRRTCAGEPCHNE